MSIDAKYRVNLSGKPFVLFAGLLVEAHTRRLVSLESQLIQAPTPENGQCAVYRARAVFQTEDGKEQTFVAHGDATPTNVTGKVAPHFMRMAETRAYARCLRWALNVGETSLEELDVDEQGDGPNRDGRSRGAAAPAVRGNAPKPSHPVAEAPRSGGYAESRGQAERAVASQAARYTDPQTGEVFPRKTLEEQLTTAIREALAVGLTVPNFMQRIEKLGNAEMIAHTRTLTQRVIEAQAGEERFGAQPQRRGPDPGHEAEFAEEWTEPGSGRTFTRAQLKATLLSEREKAGGRGLQVSTTDPETIGDRALFEEAIALSKRIFAYDRDLAGGKQGQGEQAPIVTGGPSGSHV
jgi:hypothetical protein